MLSILLERKLSLFKLIKSWIADFLISIDEDSFEPKTFFLDRKEDGLYIEVIPYANNDNN